MDGKEIFRKAVRVVVESAERALADAGLGPSDVDLFVPHQANLRIIQAACQRLGIPEERTVVVIDRYGNTSSASIPLALDDALGHGPGRPGRQPAADRLRRRHDVGQRRSTLGRMSASDEAGRPWWCWPPAGPAATAAASRWPRSARTARRSSTCWPATPCRPASAPIVLVVGPSTGPAIRYHVEHRWPDDVDVRFAHQERAPRHGARGAGGREHVGDDAAFGVANADDLYGDAALTLLAGHLAEPRHGQHAVVAFRLRNTVVGDAPVTRGVCQVGRRRAAGRPSTSGARSSPSATGASSPTTASSRPSSTATPWCR